MIQALHGKLVISLEQAVAAPYCTMRLADAGARVIKIERLSGDSARHYDASVAGESAYFAWLNRGKESVALDIKDTNDRDLIEALLSKADVYIQNFAPGALAKLGLDSQSVLQRHPTIIAIDIVGYGQATSYSDMRAYDMLVQAETGICAVTGQEGETAKVGISIADIGTGFNAYGAALEGLLARAFGQPGQAIEISMFDCMADWMSVPILHYLQTGRTTARTGMSHASIAPYGAFACKDGQVVLSIQNAAEWERFCTRVLADASLLTDPLFANNELRVANRKKLEAIVELAFAQLLVIDVIGRLTIAQIAYGRVSSLEDVAKHPALTLVPGQTTRGPFEAIASPIHKTGNRFVPSLGEHTTSIREEFVGG
jgi:itaconate CoA-transferase